MLSESGGSQRAATVTRECYNGKSLVGSASLRKEQACLAASDVLEAAHLCKEGQGMKWCRFQVGDTVSYGIVEDDVRVTEVSGTPFETCLRRDN